jgi:hypothetical protein
VWIKQDGKLYFQTQLVSKSRSALQSHQNCRSRVGYTVFYILGRVELEGELIAENTTQLHEGKSETRNIFTPGSKFGLEASAYATREAKSIDVSEEHQ